MSHTLFSQHWYRVASLKPRLSAHAQIHRHHYRGERWYVLQNHSTGNVYRFTPTAYWVIARMDGRKTIQELWNSILEEYGDDAPTQGEMIQLLSQVHAANALVCNITPDVGALLQGSQDAEKQSRKKGFNNPLFLRFPLVDPNAFLDKTFGMVRFIFSAPGLFVWFFAITTAFVFAWLNRAEIAADVMGIVITKENIFILWLVYPFIKGLHELGHGYAVKRWGGEVHEMGIMLMIFIPIPYVDATSASVFRHRWQRIVVGGAGIAVELFLASLALFFWLNAEEGIARAIAFNIMLIGGASTLFFNGNPLLKYDGYYILSDLLEIPNLTQRSLSYLGYLIKKYMLAIPLSAPPYSAQGEALWLASYAVASSLYRLLIYATIIVLVAQKFFFIGVLLSIWAIIAMFVTPSINVLKKLFNDPLFQSQRGKTLFIITSCISLVVIALFIMPFPYNTKAQGVIWAPEDSLIRASANGVVQRIIVEPNSTVQKGTALIECQDPILLTEIATMESRLKEYELRYNSTYATDPLQAQIIQEELSNIQLRLSRERDRQNGMVIRSSAEGVFALPEADNLVGRFLHQGDLLGYVLNNNNTIVRVVVPQHDIDQVRKKTSQISLRISSQNPKVYPAKIMREVPDAADSLPSAALGTAGGGQIAVDPTDKSNRKTFEKMFQFELVLDEPLPHKMIGSRVHVRFKHGYEPLAFRMIRGVRRLFLGSLHV